MSFDDTLRTKAEEALRPIFERNFLERGEIGASVSVFLDGQELANLSGGFCEKEKLHPWTAETLVPIWSATKGVAAVTCLAVLDEAGLSLDDLVCDIWPAFAGGGKQDITFRQLLSHTSGLSALSGVVPIQDAMAVANALEQQIPEFPSEGPQAYHARTFGFLLDEIVQHVTRGLSIGTCFREKFGDPMELDFWIGLPETELGRVATIYPGKMRLGEPQTPFLKAFTTKGTLTQRTFVSPQGLNAVQDLNQPETLQKGYASMGGVGSARALASFYSMLAQGGIWQGRRLLSEAVIASLSETISQQEDGVLCTQMAFGPGVMRDPLNADGSKARQLFGSGLKAFGHPGAGGSLAFGDPGRRLSFAYVMNQMELGVLPNSKSL
ncbi:MAG TPA: serine hydrolase domain-containing protein, partial [Verrucomicrobium sp.]|nr:serine hydrolase domain-containing protein [Verrucomicrobium sp.]